MRSIPSDKAQEALRERFARVTYGFSTRVQLKAMGPPAQVIVDPTHFEIALGPGRMSHAYGDVTVSTWTQQTGEAAAPRAPHMGAVGAIRAAAAPSAALAKAFNDILVYLEGSPGASSAAAIGVPALEDAEVIVDALASLGARMGDDPRKDEIEAKKAKR